LIGVVTSGTPLLIIISLCENGSLKHQLEKRVRGEGKLAAQPGALPPKMDADIGLEIAQGVQHLVEYHLVHRDLAARNVLLDSQLVAKVADFGLSRAFSTVEGKDYYKSTTGMMALRWTAPEAMTTFKFSEKSDVWHGARFPTEIYTRGCIRSHACSLEAGRCVTNGIPLGCPRVLPGHTVNCVRTLKGVWNGAA